MAKLQQSQINSIQTEDERTKSKQKNIQKREYQKLMGNVGSDDIPEIDEIRNAIQE